MSSSARRHRPTVFLHVGAPKTGTTFIQEVLWAHRDALAGDGVLLPGQRPHHFQATLDIRQARLDRHPGVRPGVWQRLADEALAWDGTVVISHELFAGATEAQARRAVESLEPAEVHIVYTARDLARQIPAEWQERIKHRRRDNLDEFVDQVVARGPKARWFWKVQDPADVVRRWGALVPPDHVHVITVPPSGSEPGLLWRRFAELIGLDPAAYDTSVARPNVSLGLNQVDLLRRVNLAMGTKLSQPGAYPRFVKEVLAHQVLVRGPDNVKFGFDPARRDWVMERSRQMIDELAKTDCDVVGDLDELVPAVVTPNAVHPRDVDSDRVADAGADAVARLMTRLRQQTLRAEEAERRLAQVESGRPWPRKQTLVALSERHRAVMRARHAYRWAADAAGRIGRTRSGHTRGDRS